MLLSKLHKKNILLRLFALILIFHLMDFVVGLNHNQLQKHWNIHRQGESAIELLLNFILSNDHFANAEANFPLQMEEENKKFEEYLPVFKFIKPHQNFTELKFRKFFYKSFYKSVYLDVITPPPKV